jgi:hypothetical protein
MTPDEFFARYEESALLFDEVLAVLGACEPFQMQITKSQITFRASKPFAWVWIPRRYFQRNTVPLLLSIMLPKRDSSPRWKEIAEPFKGRFMHHLELRVANIINNEVIEWLKQARANVE